MARIRVVVSDNSKVILEKEFLDFPITFGRNPTNQIVLPFDFISRSHCVLLEEDDGVVLIDMHSAYGVFIDGQKVERANVNDGVTFVIQNLSIKIEILGALGKIVEAANPNPVYPPIPVVVSDFDGMSRIPMIEKDFRPILMSAHPTAQQARFRKIEAVISWHDVIYDIQEFDPDDKITVGPLGKADIAVPLFRHSMTVAKVGRDKTKCFALKDHKISVANNIGQLSSLDLIEKNILIQKGQKYFWSMGLHDVTTVDFGSGVELHLRYVPGTKALSRAKMIEPDEAIKQSLIGSAILHVALALIIFAMAPAGRVGPNLKNVPQRYARLLVEKPKPKPPPPPPKEVAKKEPPKPVEKVVKHQKIMKLPKVLAKKNKFPIEVKHPIAKAPPPVKVEALGALGALGAMSKTAAPNVVTNININPNAGGLPQKAINTGGIAGALPSSNGKLAAAGGSRVKTKGFGYGTGTGYGIQGLKGTAGTRGVAGAIVGEPKLASMTKVEGLTRAQVMAVLKQYMGEVQHCYEKNLLANPDLAGRIDFEWDIGPAGHVTDVRVKRSTVNNGDGLVECVRKVFTSMPFPKAKNGMITTPTIGFPFGRI